MFDAKGQTKKETGNFFNQKSSLPHVFFYPALKIIPPGSN